MIAPISGELRNIKEDVIKHPMKLSWTDLSYTVKAQYSKKAMEAQGATQKTYEKVLLKKQHGYVNSGEALFIMGSSGAGKTTLLNALCDRLQKTKNYKLEGDILLNNSHPVSQKDFGKYGVYVMQDDVLFPTLTCEEAIKFSAQLRTNLQGQDLKLKVNETIEALNLIHSKKTLIGDKIMKGLRPGERKRTAIAIELVTDPDIIFLDEPTSGLDSFTANKIVKLLVDQAKAGKTVVATIHQPSSSTYSLFDRLLLLMDGYPIYQGKAQEAGQYFDKIGFKIPKFANPADYYLKEFFIPFNKTKKDEQKLETLLDGYQSHIAGKILGEDKAIENFEVTDQYLKEAHPHAGMVTEFMVLTRRTGLNLIRNPNSTTMRALMIIVTSILMSLVFWDLSDSNNEVQNKTGFCFFLGVNMIMSTLQSIIVIFIMERPVFLREYASKSYGLWSYYTSKSVLEIPFQFITPVLISCVVYFTCGMTVDFGKFCIFTLTLMLAVLAATSIGFFIGCIFTDASTATQASMIIMLPFIVFGGYMVNLNDVYPWLSWLQYTSPIRFVTEALVRNEFENNDDYSNPQEIFDKYDYNVGLGWSILIILLIGIIYRGLAYIALKLTISKVQ
ncbi:unnamed protein product [Moneuplotes crassus]|uniref:ABC transporter domain-containing protein n=1 Tax=Euplotes crassus TaxID=5936 RepID=A0AAD1Y928_EUPCR|nr:unnamed protein product [Moneuplotes crassus]